MFVRVKTTPNSPRRSVQVVRSVRSGDKVSQRIVRYMGIALDDAQEAKLRAMAQEFIDRTAAEALNEDSLYKWRHQSAKAAAQAQPAGFKRIELLSRPAARFR